MFYFFARILLLHLLLFFFKGNHNNYTSFSYSFVFLNICSFRQSNRKLWILFHLGILEKGGKSRRLRYVAQILQLTTRQGGKRSTKTREICKSYEIDT